MIEVNIRVSRRALLVGALAATVAVSLHPVLEYAVGLGMLIFLVAYGLATRAIRSKWATVPSSLRWTHVGVGLGVVAAVIRLVEVALAGGKVPLPGYADILSVPALVVVIVSLVLAARARAAASRLNDVLDAAAAALMPAATLAVVGWPYLLGRTGAGLAERLVNGAVFTLDIAFLATVLLMIYGPGSKSPASIWLGLAGTIMMAFDFGVFWGLATGAGWVDQMARISPLAMICYAAGVTHPDFVRFAQPGTRPQQFRAGLYPFALGSMVALALATRHPVGIAATFVSIGVASSRVALASITSQRLIRLAKTQGRFGQDLSEADTTEAAIAAAERACLSILEGHAKVEIDTRNEVGRLESPSAERRTDSSRWSTVLSTSERVSIHVNGKVAPHNYVALAQLADVLDPALRSIVERHRRMRLEAQADAEAAWRAITEAAHVVGLLVEDDVVVRATPNSTRQIGFDPVGMPVVDIAILNHPRAGSEEAYLDPDGSGKWVKTTRSEQPDGSTICTIIDVSTERAAALIDPQTSLPNIEALRSRPDLAGVVLYLLHVHGTDRATDDRSTPLLGEVAAAVCGRLRSDDNAWRGEGPTIVVVSPLGEGTDWFDDRIAELTRTVEPLVDTSPALTVGLVEVPGTITPDGAIRRAGLALKHGLLHAPGKVTVFTDRLDQAFRRVWDIESHLTEAMGAGDLADYGFRVEYQPIVDGKSSDPVAVEALVRCTHPVFGPIFPDEFIPVAERLGLVARIDRFVLLTAVADLDRLQQFIPDLSLHVNLAPAGMAEPDLGRLMEQLDSEPEAKTSLILEVTETALGSTSMETLVDACNRLVELGVRLSIDDFGDGESNFARVAELPVSEVKLARHFAKSRDQRLIKGVVDSVHALDMSVVAENVETADQAQILTDCGADQLQGYLFSRPLPLEDLVSWIASRHDLSTPAAL